MESNVLQKDDFNWNSYVNNYPDLRNKIKTPESAWKHYITYGKNEGRTDITSYKSHPYYTHQPFLSEILKNTTGNILECGCGHGSTIFIKNLISTNLQISRKLVTLESDKEWLNKFIYLNDDLHELYNIDATNDDNYENAKIWTNFIDSNLKDYDFEVIFIDCSPWLSRKEIFEYFKNTSAIIVIHDFDYFPNNNLIGKTISKEYFKRNDSSIQYEKIQMGEMDPYFKLYYPPVEFFVGETGPPTLVFCSNKDKFDNIINIIDSNIKKYY